MIWGKYPQAKDITPVSASLAEFVKGWEQKALDSALAETEKELDQVIWPQCHWVRIKIKPGAIQLPEFPVKVLRILKESGDEVGATEYTVDSEHAVLFSDLLDGEYRIEYQVGYVDGELPATIQMILVAFGKFFLSDHSEDKVEALSLVRAWKVIRKRMGELRDGISKTG